MSTVNQVSLVEIETLKNSIMEIIKDNNYNWEDLGILLNPITEYSENTIFIQNLNHIVQIIIKDRDGNFYFDVDDLKLLSDDIIAITKIITGLLLVISSIPHLKLKYDAGATEELIFKFLTYIFFVIIPKETGRPWSYIEKEHVVELTVLIYGVVKSAQVTKDLVSKIISWFKSKNLCKCFKEDKQEHKQKVFDKKIIIIKEKLKSIIHKNKDILELRKELVNIKKDIKRFYN